MRKFIKTHLMIKMPNPLIKLFGKRLLSFCHLHDDGYVRHIPHIGWEITEVGRTDEKHKRLSMEKTAGSKLLILMSLIHRRVKVQVQHAACGVCAWDLATFRDGGYAPPGHEGVGYVTKVGSGVRDIEEGMRVASVALGFDGIKNCSTEDLYIPSKNRILRTNTGLLSRFRAL